MKADNQLKEKFTFVITYKVVSEGVQEQTDNDWAKSKYQLCNFLKIWFS